MKVSMPTAFDDDLIIGLVMTLNGNDYEPDDRDGEYSYFVTDGIEYQGKLYKLIWLTEEHQVYIGVINAYRR